VNIYCNGARVLAAGYDPIAGDEFPQLISPGRDTVGDMWKVALITTEVSSGILTCAVAPVASQNPDLAHDGSSAYCVDDAIEDGANSQVLLSNTGTAPTTGAISASTDLDGLMH